MVVLVDVVEIGIEQLDRGDDASLQQSSDLRGCERYQVQSMCHVSQSVRCFAITFERTTGFDDVRAVEVLGYFELVVSLKAEASPPASICISSC